MSRLFSWSPNRTFLLWLSLILTCGLLTTQAWGQTDESWPQFLGPHRNGTVIQTGLVDSIPAGGLQELWRVPGGVGMSAVVVDRQDAITVIRRDGQQQVICLDAETGKQKWLCPLGPEYDNAMGNGTRATPAITKDSVIAFSGDGQLASIERTTGKRQWQVDVVGSLGGKIAEYGMASSPLVSDDLIYVIAGAPDALVAAYDLNSGKLKWKAGQGVCGYSSPTLLNLAGQATLLAFAGDGLYAFEPETGKSLWNYPFVTNYDCNIAVPIALEDDLFISAGENHGAVRLHVSHDNGKWTVEEVWMATGKNSPLRNEWQTAIVIKGLLYGMDNVGGAGPITHLACVNADSGDLVWREERFGKGNYTLADGKLFLSTMKGELILATVDRKGYHELGRQPLLGMTRQSPTICQGRLYLRDDKEIVCVKIQK